MSQLSLYRQLSQPPTPQNDEKSIYLSASGTITLLDSFGNTTPFSMQGHTHIQADSHLSADTDSAATALHHTLGNGVFQACAGNDSRLSDSRTPTSHAASHASGGGDAVALAQSQVTNLTTDLAAKATDNAVVHNTGNETVAGVKTFSSSPLVPTVAQGNNSTTAATTAFVIAEQNMHRNILINGDFRIDQRNNGAAQTLTAGTANYCVDRWYGKCAGANVTGQQVAGSGPNQYRYQFTGAASTSGIYFGQRIEAANCYWLNSSVATLSVDLANSLLSSVTWTASYADSIDIFGSITQIATGTFTVNASMTRYSVTFSIPSAATTGIEIGFNVGAQTSGTWSLGSVQLEAGTVATPYEYRDFASELAKCKRYYELWPGEIFWCGNTTSGITYYIDVPWTVEKRKAAYTATAPDGGNNSGFAAGAPVIQVKKLASMRIYKASNSSASGGYFNTVNPTADAEL